MALLSSFVKGADEMGAKIKAAQEKIHSNLMASARRELGIELEEMGRRCPVDVRYEAPHPGALRDSRKLEIEDDGKKIIARFSFGGTSDSWPGFFVDYEVIVHEDLEAHHEVGQAKYMESVLDEARPFLMARIGAGATL